jgi:uncharacterized protein DUF4440
MLKTLIRALRSCAITHMVPPGATGAQECTGTISVEEALKAEEARFAAQMSGDVTAMQRLFGDDLVYIHSSTLEDTKASFIESIRSGNVKYRSMKRSDVKVRTYGCIAIVTGTANFDVTARGQELSLHLLYHAVWAKRASGPQFVSWQATRVMPK